jgi:peptidoglycan hydrolase-like protein with peptidoglycan-binding domain
MKRLSAAFFTIALLAVAAIAQESSGPSAEAKPAPKVFRATKDQIKEVQTKLKSANHYTGEATGKLDDATRKSIKIWQGGNGLKQTGTLNRATLEKMGIALTETQKLIPVSESSYASETEKTAEKKENSSTEKPKRTVFRATKDQITEAQKKLKAGNMYSGDETGKLDSATRDGLKKYQEANGIKVTGTLNQVTLEKMGIELTEKQKASAAAAPSK